MHKFPEIKERFAKAVQDNRLLRGLVTHSEKIEGGFYILGNLLLMSKDAYATGSFELTPSAMAGMVFMGSDTSFALSKHYPWTRRISGVCIMTAGSLLMYDGMKDSRGLAGMILGTGMIILSGLQILLENQMRRASEYLSSKPRTGAAAAFARAAEKYTAYPLLVTAAPNFVQKPAMIGSAMMRGDFLFATTSFLWMIGDTGMALTDKLFKDMLKKPETKAEQAVSAPAVNNP